MWSAIRLPAWRRQFAGKRAKSGDPRIGGGISNVSGAILSCTHVTDGVRRIAVWSLLHWSVGFAVAIRFVVHAVVGRSSVRH